MTGVATAGPIAPSLVPTPRAAVRRARARLDAPSVDPLDAAEILLRYGLVARGRPRNLALANRSRTVEVRSDRGSVVLRRYRDAWELPAIVHEHSILAHLERERFPAPRLLGTTVGSTIVEHRGARYAVFRFDPGRSPGGIVLPRSRRARLIDAMADRLAALHETLAGVAPAGRHHLGLDPGTGTPRADLAWHVRTLERLAASPPANGDAEQEAWDALRRRIPQLVDDLASAHSALVGVPLSTLVIHGDYGAHNVLLRRDGTIAIYDFELARTDVRLVDLVIVLGRLGSDAPRFLERYRARVPDVSGELRSLPAVWRYHRLCGAVRSWDNHARLGETRRLHAATARLDEAAEIARGEAGPWTA